MDGTESGADFAEPESALDGALEDGAEGDAGPADEEPPELEEEAPEPCDCPAAPFCSGAVGTLGTEDAGGGAAGVWGALAGADLKPCITPPSRLRL